MHITPVCTFLCPGFMVKFKGARTVTVKQFEKFSLNLSISLFVILVNLFHPQSAYEVKNNCSIFERLLIKKSGVYLFGISFFVLEIFAYLYYANEETDDVIDRSTKTIKY